MKKVLVLAASAKRRPGLALLIVPSLVVRLLFGAELTGVAIPVARVLGIALIGLGAACWPRVGIPRTLRDVDLQRAYHGVSLVSRHSWRMGRPSPVAGSCVTCSPDAASRAGLVQDTQRYLNLTS